MSAKNKYQLVLGKAHKSIALASRAERRVKRTRPAKMTIAPQRVVRALKATSGSKELLAKIPNLIKWQVWSPLAPFSVCQKSGTAIYLDLWDADHFDGFTDMKHNLSECRAWFSAEGFVSWDSPQTKTGRINCYFRAPTAGNYVCNH